MTKPAVRRLERTDWIRLTMRRPTAPVRSSGSEELIFLGKRMGEALFDIVGFDTTVGVAPGDVSAFAAATGSGLVACSYVAPGLDQPIRIGMQRASLRALLEAACGGRLMISRAGDEPGFGALERRLAMHAFDRLSRAIGETFEKFERGLAFARRDADLEFGWDQSGSAEDLIVVEFVGENASHRIYLQAPAMGKLAGSSGPGAWNQLQKGPDLAWRALLARQIARTPVVLSATIRHVGMTIDDVQALTPGAVISLAASPQSDIELVTSDTCLFRCRLGQDGGAYTVRIVDGSF